MKMGKRKLKALDSIGVKVLNKPSIVSKPSNRAERRAKARFDRKYKCQPRTD